MPGKIGASLNDKLRQVEWGEYKISEFLNWQPQKEIDPLKLDVLTDSTENIYPFYGQATVNNGIISYNQLRRDVLNNKEGKPTILIHSNNQNIVYVETPFYLKDGHGATSVLQSEHLNKTNQMFIIAVIDRVIKEKYSYNHKATKIELKNTIVHLPVKKGKIDYDFMENFIVELEAQHIAELEAYLSATGLKDYALTVEEEKSLEDYPALNFKEYDILDIFSIKNTSNILSCDIKENSGRTPYLCASSENNSVSSYIKYNESYLEEGNCIFIGGKTFVVSYQEYDFYSNDSHNLALYLNNQDARTKVHQLYLATCVYKSLSHKYSWGDSVSKAKIKYDRISLPTKDGKPDYKEMELLISAVQKLVIKDVVLYSKEKLRVTKNVATKVQIP